LGKLGKNFNFSLVVFSWPKSLGAFTFCTIGGMAEIPTTFNLGILYFFCFIFNQEINIVILLKLGTVMENPPLLTTNVQD
jgi:hypothetical protein